MGPKFYPNEDQTKVQDDELDAQVIEEKNVNTPAMIGIGTKTQNTESYGSKLMRYYLKEDCDDKGVELKAREQLKEIKKIEEHQRKIRARVRDEMIWQLENAAISDAHKRDCYYGRGSGGEIMLKNSKNEAAAAAEGPQEILDREAELDHEKDENMSGCEHAPTVEGGGTREGSLLSRQMRYRFEADSEDEDYDEKPEDIQVEEDEMPRKDTLCPDAENSQLLDKIMAKEPYNGDYCFPIWSGVETGHLLRDHSDVKNCDFDEGIVEKGIEKHSRSVN